MVIILSICVHEVLEPLIIELFMGELDCRNINILYIHCLHSSYFFCVWPSVATGFSTQPATAVDQVNIINISGISTVVV